MASARLNNSALRSATPRACLCSRSRSQRILASVSKSHDAPSDAASVANRREFLIKPTAAALLASAASLATPQSAHALIKPTALAVDDFSTGIAAAHLGPLGGAVGCNDYKEFEKVIYGFVEGIKTGECPPWAKDTVRAFLLKEEGGNRVMLTILIPSAELKNALPFFVESGPKANPLWAQSNETWKDPNTPIFATGSEAFLVRGEANANKNIKGKYFGQYQLGWNGTIDEWIPQFTVPEANEFHNSVGIEFSVAHKLDLKTPGNAYKTKARNGLEVFHCFNSVDGAKAFEKAFAPDSPFFVNEPKYVGPYVQTIWKVVDDIVFKA